MLLLLYVKMGSSEEMIRLLRGNCLTEIRKIEQELNATIRDDGIIDKLKHMSRSICGGCYSIINESNSL